MRIDAHHHLWLYNPRDFAWIDQPAAALRRDFLPQEFRAALAGAQVDASVVVQARQSLDNTRWLSKCAEQSGGIAGGVGWMPLTDSEALSASLHEFKRKTRFIVAREILQDKPSGFLLDSALNDGVRQLVAHDLPYDFSSAHRS